MTTMKILPATLPLLILFSTIQGAFSDDRELAVTLSKEGDHAGAAIEFRRLALEEAKPESQAGYYWASAYEYGKALQFGTAGKMLDAGENASPELKAPGLLLRGEQSRSEKKWPEASFYFRSLILGEASADVKTYSSRRLAESCLRQNNLPAAREALSLSPTAQNNAAIALDRYEQDSDKSPKVGGILGLIPGLGYAYAGEYANALRSAILNSLFIFGMVTTAEDEQWGGFAVITFFEFTWYSGSIYGGIDASHRYNSRRLEDCAREIDSDAAFSPDYSRLPEIALKFTF